VLLPFYDGLGGRAGGREEEREGKKGKKAWKTACKVKVEKGRKKKARKKGGIPEGGMERLISRKRQDKTTTKQTNKTNLQLGLSDVFLGALVLVGGEEEGFFFVFLAAFFGGSQVFELLGFWSPVRCGSGEKEGGKEGKRK
jgi:hypothetical protein